MQCLEHALLEPGPANITPLDFGLPVYRRQHSQIPISEMVCGLKSLHLTDDIHIPGLFSSGPSTGPLFKYNRTVATELESLHLVKEDIVTIPGTLLDVPSLQKSPSISQLATELGLSIWRRM
ncbi:hypothetical protein BT96DRAFT_1010402 [Gymnopus androsaceus JB14]|uniref:Uncharacterized protein n=1 Tax=Gymnopus androsaceus JB14 TaxID=1447944 RepID=A0A6A4GAQ4_9AGAR|nr:hypothetical protein BT96DRAFT_1010402 [Gymnopus androsaceus JB14]